MGAVRILRVLGIAVSAILALAVYQMSASADGGLLDETAPGLLGDTETLSDGSPLEAVQGGAAAASDAPPALEPITSLLDQPAPADETLQHLPAQSSVVEATETLPDAGLVPAQPDGLPSPDLATDGAAASLSTVVDEAEDLAGSTLSTVEAVSPLPLPEVEPPALDPVTDPLLDAVPELPLLPGVGDLLRPAEDVLGDASQLLPSEPLAPVLDPVEEALTDLPSGPELLVPVPAPPADAVPPAVELPGPGAILGPEVPRLMAPGLPGSVAWQPPPEARQPGTAPGTDSLPPAQASPPVSALPPVLLDLPAHTTDGRGLLPQTPGAPFVAAGHDMAALAGPSDPVTAGPRSAARGPGESHAVHAPRPGPASLVQGSGSSGQAAALLAAALALSLVFLLLPRGPLRLAPRSLSFQPPSPPG